jgi:hypothetical protein
MATPKIEIRKRIYEPGQTGPAAHIYINGKELDLDSVLAFETELQASGSFKVTLKVLAEVTTSTAEDCFYK